MIDFTNCTLDNLRAYDGANGSKICVFYNNERYMIKFPALAKDNKDMHYSNGCLNEHIASSIFSSLGIETQETKLGVYRNKSVVACKDFCEPGERILNFGMIKNRCIDSDKSGFGTELQSVLDAIDMQQVYDPLKMKDHFWKMFAADALLGNFDRHNGNWGIVVNEINNHVRIAPVYDNGSCLYPQLTDKQMENILNDRNELDRRLYVFPNSALKLNDKKINYLDFLSNTKDPNCIEALRYVQRHYDQKKVDKILNETPMSDIKRNFYHTMITARKEHIIDKAMEQHLDKNIRLKDGSYITGKELQSLILSGKTVSLWKEDKDKIHTIEKPDR